MDAGYGEHNGLADSIASVFDDNHRSIVKISDALLSIFAGSNDFDLHRLTGQDKSFEGIGKVIDVYDINTS